MAMKTKSVEIDNIAPANLENFRKNQFANAKTKIQIFLMWLLAWSLVIFLFLLILVGVAEDLLPPTEGVKALSRLFVEIAANAKAVALVCLGFFFREYLSSREF